MLLNFEHVSKSYGDGKLLDDASFWLTPGERLGVVGVNGCGKSTLLKLAAGVSEPDAGSVSTDPNVRISYLSQEPVYDAEELVIDYVLDRQPADAREVARYEAEEILTRLGIDDYSAQMSTLSGGQRKRAALAQCLVSPADVLILDEPTNHLDIEMIDWLESYVSKFAGAVLFVSHDRYFLEHLATRTAEVSFGRLFIYDGGYSSWLDGKAEREEMEAASERKRQSILRRELAWVLQGPCARGTKSRERLERYAALKAKLPPETDGTISDVTLPASRLGKKTIELHGISKAFGGRELIKDFDFILRRDERAGIIGLNGCGKSTLLNIISGRLEPDSGSVETGSTVKIGYFSQHSDELDGTQTAYEYIRERGESIETSEGRISAGKLMEMFLFPPVLQTRKISALSGGERRRLFLLGILAAAPNVLLLDEPTNDLDIPTLQVLENYLQTYPGAVMTVSHDRYFLDRVCNRVFVMAAGKGIREFNGGFSDCEEYISSLSSTLRPERARREHPAAEAKSPSHQERKLRFSFKEQREFETIDGEIAELEKEIEEIGREQELNFSDYLALQELELRRQETEAKLEEKMERWMYLNELAEKIAQQ